MKSKNNSILGQVAIFVVNILFWGCILLILWVTLHIFIYSSFSIPSDSMKPALVAGDQILVGKTIPGTRIYNPFAGSNHKVNIRRLPGLRKVRHNDVLVFNFPYVDTWDTVKINMESYFVKRCIGLPGDSLEIRNGYYYINGQQAHAGNEAAQKILALKKKEDFEPDVYQTFPYHPAYPWNIQHFGPLCIPGKGIRIPLGPHNLCLYKRWIEWEQGKKAEIRANEVYIGDQKTDSYCFQKNYYFMGGDRVEDSKDSRYWGFLPEECIVGKAWIIWKSEIKGRTGKLIE